MSSRLSVSVVKTIQFRTEIVEEDGTVRYGWNHRYRSAHAAAENYTVKRIIDWERKRFPNGCRNLTAIEVEHIEKLKRRFHQFVLRKFKEMLA